GVSVSCGSVLCVAVVSLVESSLSYRGECGGFIPSLAGARPCSLWDYASFDLMLYVVLSVAYWPFVLGMLLLPPLVGDLLDRPRLEFLRRRIESHEHVRVGVAFYIPDDPAGSRDGIGLRARAARRRPLLRPPRRGIEAAQFSAGVVRVIDDVVGHHREPPRTGALSQEILTNLHRDRIDAADAVPHQLREERDALRVDHQAVRLRVRGRHRHQLDPAGGWSQPANHV